MTGPDPSAPIRHPYARVTFHGKKLYGTTNGVGPHNNGVLFKMTVE
jgi:uncharacterized repeat protein (TIGR03803 family)